MRLTRLITSDDLGQWWVKDPLDRWMHGHPPTTDAATAASARAADVSVDLVPLVERAMAGDAVAQAQVEDWKNSADHWGEKPPGRLKFHRYLAGLECAHCWGFWAGVLVLGSYVATGRSQRARAAWRFVAGTLTLNTVTATLGTKLDYWG